MTMSQRDTVRAAVIRDLLENLEELLVASLVIPAVEQPQRWSTDAEKITGQLSRMLSSARARLPLPAPTPILDGADAERLR